MFKLASTKSFISEKQIAKYKLMKQQQQQANNNQEKQNQFEEAKLAPIESDEDEYSGEEVECEDIPEDFIQPQQQRRSQMAPQPQNFAPLHPQLQQQQLYQIAIKDQKPGPNKKDALPKQMQQKKRPQTNQIRGPQPQQLQFQQFAPQDQIQKLIQGINLDLRQPQKGDPQLKFSIETKNEFKPSKLRKAEKKKKMVKRQVDTNVFCIDLGQLTSAAEIASGDPIYCSTCKGIFNQFSQISGGSESGQIWNCEFCLSKNQVSIDEEEEPKSSTVNYFLKASASTLEENKTSDFGALGKGMEKKDDITVVFALDVSGSMKGQRLDCLKSVLTNAINDLADKYPNRKVGIVLFETFVKVFGDCSHQESIFISNVLNYDFIKETGTNLAETYLSLPVNKQQKNLLKTISQLTAHGGTALGPGLLTSVALAQQGLPGSMVILVTDGAAANGLGSFTSITSQDPRQFYKKVGLEAQKAGVMVSMLFIEGAECNIQALCQVAELTGGEVQRVNKTDMGENFESILNLKVIATQVRLVVQLHKGLEFRNEEENCLSNSKSVLTKYIGNVTQNSEITFEYKVKRVKELLLINDIDLENLKTLPFQAQIYFKNEQGDDCLRVISSNSEVGTNRKEIEEKADFELLGLNAIKQTSKLAKNGNYQEAQLNAKAWDKHLQKSSVPHQQQAYQCYKLNMDGMYNQIRQQPQQVQPQNFAGINHTESKVQQQSDAFCNQLYNNMHMNSKHFKVQQKWNK